MLIDDKHRSDAHQLPESTKMLTRFKSSHSQTLVKQVINWQRLWVILELGPANFNWRFVKKYLICGKQETGSFTMTIDLQSLLDSFWPKMARFRCSTHLTFVLCKVIRLCTKFDNIIPVSFGHPLIIYRPTFKIY